MSVELTQPQEMLHQMVTDFADNEIKPANKHIDQKSEVPKDLWQKIIDTGFLGLILSEKYGGAGFNAIAEAQTIYDVASRNASVAFTLEGHYKTVDQVMKYATESLKDKYLPQANHRIFAFSSTEHQGGSNVM